MKKETLFTLCLLLAVSLILVTSTLADAKTCSIRGKWVDQYCCVGPGETGCGSRKSRSCKIDVTKDYCTYGSTGCPETNTYTCFDLINEGCTYASWTCGDCQTCGASNGECLGGCSSSQTCKNSICVDNCVSTWGAWSECNSSGKQIRTQTCTGNKQTRDCLYFDTPYFASLDEPNIQLDSTDIGDTVLLRFGGKNINSDSDIDFYVQVKDTSWAALFGLLEKWGNFNKISGQGYSIYKAEFAKKHRINASADGEDIYKISSELTVSPIANNSPPIAVIELPQKPLLADEFINIPVGYPILFKQESSDGDDLLRINWDFGDGENVTFYNYSKNINSTSADTSHRYSRDGPFIVKLTATEMSRDNTDTDNIKIRVFKEGINIVPVISNPLPNSVQSYLVWYNASQSYVVNCSKSFHPTNPSEGFDVEDLGCKYLLSPGAMAPLEGTVKIRWRQVDSDGNSIPRGWFTNEMNWNETNYNSIVTFPVIHKRPEMRRIFLEIDYEEI